MSLKIKQMEKKIITKVVKVPYVRYRIDYLCVFLNSLSRKYLVHVRADKW